MKNLLLTFLLFLFAIPLAAQKLDIRLATGLMPLTQVQRVAMPLLNNKALQEAELTRRGPGIAPKFAQNIEVLISPQTHGNWETASNGIEVWRLRIHSQGAKSLNLGFSKYFMPSGGSMVLYPMHEKGQLIGPFTPSDNEEHEQLWTPIVNGDELVIEVQVPSTEKENLQLELKSVNHDFIGFAELTALSGACNLDVVCGAADGWGIVDGYRDIIRSVAVISKGGGTFCTGFLVNNVNNDCTPFFMTAEHCGVDADDAASLVAYWNFENSTCRQPNSLESGMDGDGQLLDFNTGAIWRAEWDDSDFTLVELDDPVSETANPFFAGWTAEFVYPGDTVIGVHHPTTDEKRISFDFDTVAFTAGNNQVIDINNSNVTHVIVHDWDIGTTEGGSSGSPLFNHQKQVIGQLQGGAAACGNDSHDIYGWFHKSWYGGGTPETSLRFWLDPDNTGVESMAGKDCGFTVAINPQLIELCAPDDAIFNVSVNETFASDVTLSASNIPPGASVNFSPNPVAPGAQSIMTVTDTEAAPSGQYQIVVLGTNGAEGASSSVSLTLFESIPDALNLMNPSNGAIDVVTSPDLFWEAASTGTSYTIEIAEDATFANIVDMATGLTTPMYGSITLDILSTYYWRVKAENLCGGGPWSPVWSFMTADVLCESLVSPNVPITIETASPNVATSTLFVSTSGLVTEVSVIDLDIAHTYVGDVSASLTSPSGTVVQLFDRPGNPNSPTGCGNDNLFVSFEDDAANTAEDFDMTCVNGTYAIEGTFQPIDPLLMFAGEEANGTWTLTVEDALAQDGGAINAWSLDICTTVAPDLSLSSSTSQALACLGDELELTLTIGTAFASTGVTLSVTGNPMGSQVIFSNNPATPGEVLNVTITNIPSIGNYDLVFNASDDTQSTDASVSLTISDSPSAASLTVPEDGASGIVVTPTLEWDAVSSATSYDVEIATDNAFSNLIVSGGTTLSNYTLSLVLENETTYYWRIIAINGCGATVSETNTFTTESVLAIDELESNNFSILPNPTTGHFEIVFEQIMNKHLTIEIYSVDGKLLQHHQINDAFQGLPFDLSNYSSGVYLVKMKTFKAAIVRRIVLSK